MESNDSDKDSVPSCVDLFYYWRRCSSSINQFRFYYIYGTFRDCSEHMTSFRKCMSYKTTKSEETKQQLLESQAKIKEDTKKLIGNSNPVWKLREKPPADWNRYNKDEFSKSS
ncbi:UPF0545 protein C22orf39-like protein [Trichoplax sp. H2]|nr:UPF0545 protein C22orf39-like protein [Trichoplax sp. H2]|eukprot:RDD47682.1 UPF0545 protein C22orf39-like protein [Trichoplax sp. H2]